MSDLYETPLDIIDAVLASIDPSTRIWEPFKGTGRSTEHMRARGFDVVNSIDGEEDFFKMEVPEDRLLVSNPPYSCKQKIVRRVADKGIDAILFVPLETLTSAYLEAACSKRDMRPQLLYCTRRVSFLLQDGRMLAHRFPYAVGWLCLSKQRRFERDLASYRPLNDPYPMDRIDRPLHGDEEQLFGGQGEGGSEESEGSDGEHNMG